jgi:hypothetical protein
MGTNQPKPEPTGCREVKTIGGKEYWTTSKAARHLGISKVALLNYVKSRRISNLRIGTAALFRPEWLDDYIDEQTTIGVATRKGAGNG